MSFVAFRATWERMLYEAGKENLQNAPFRAVPSGLKGNSRDWG